VDIAEKVLERLATTESTTLTFKREDGGKIRVASLLWPEPKVILRGEVLQVRNVAGRPRCLPPARSSCKSAMSPVARAVPLRRDPECYAAPQP
jgi:hypothetical protein